MPALKSGHPAGEAVHQGLMNGNLSPATSRSTGRGEYRKPVYGVLRSAVFVQGKLINAPREAGGLIPDCLSGDVNKDYPQLWVWICEFVPLPDDLPYGEPLLAEAVAA